MPTLTSDHRVLAELSDRARELGFDRLAITDAGLPDGTGENLRSFIRLDRHGSMSWMADTLERRVNPKAMWPEAKSAVVVAMNYAPEMNPMARLKKTRTGVISVYALNRDYHDIIKGKLKTLAGWLVSRTGSDVKVFVDTAPLMEKPLAARAGLGWQGKHTNLVSRGLGSWFFLGVILTTAELQAQSPEVNHCGNCRACLDICPTDAFPAPYQLDARRCISYLTIEHKGHIDRDLRPAMGNRIYGCDDCLAVCPWNKFAQAAHETKLTARDDLMEPPLQVLADLDDAGFRKLFSGSPVKRIGRDRFIRNVLIAIGNSADTTLIPVARMHLGDDSPLVRAMAVWALGRLSDPDEFAMLKDKHEPCEPDEQVQLEWRKT